MENQFINLDEDNREIHILLGELKPHQILGLDEAEYNKDFEYQLGSRHYSSAATIDKLVQEIYHLIALELLHKVHKTERYVTIFKGFEEEDEIVNICF